MILPRGTLALLVHLRDQRVQDFAGRVVEVAGGPVVNEDGEGYLVVAGWLLAEFGVETVWAASRCLLPLNPPTRWTEKRERLTV